MIVIMDNASDQFAFGETLSDAIQKWTDCYGYPCDIEHCLVVEGKQKKASIVLSDVEKPKTATSKPTASKK